MYTASHRKTDRPTIYTKGEVKFIVVPHQREQSLPVFSGLLLVTFAAIETGSRVSLFTSFRVVCRGSRQGGSAGKSRVHLHIQGEGPEPLVLPRRTCTEWVGGGLRVGLVTFLRTRS